MVMLSNSLIDELAQKSVNIFNNMPKTGKPVAHEWTVLSSIIQHSAFSGTEMYEVVSLGTGSKCIGASQMSPKGVIINDSHAEVCARRGFLLYLYDNIDYALENKESIFTVTNNKFKLKDNIEFIFYSSQLPCGDASIFSKGNQDEEHGDVIISTKHKSESPICNIDHKKSKLSEDIYRTGAKCLEMSNQDPKESGVKYHLLSQVRTKPGRGDRTLSVSCSDKIARWIHIGVQGALLDMLLVEPIYIPHFIFGGGVPYSSESLNRALLNRDVDKNTLKNSKIIPVFYQSSVIFPFIKSNNKVRAAPGSIVWIKTKNVVCELADISPVSFFQLLILADGCDILSLSLYMSVRSHDAEYSSLGFRVKTEVAIQGRKLGVTKKKANSVCGSLCISKVNIYRRFLRILRKSQEIRNNVVKDKNLEKITYSEMKSKSDRYVSNWLLLKNNFFHIWTVKPDMWNFSIEDII